MTSACKAAPGLGVCGDEKGRLALATSGLAASGGQQIERSWGSDCKQRWRPHPSIPRQALEALLLGVADTGAAPRLGPLAPVERGGAAGGGGCTCRFQTAAHVGFTSISLMARSVSCAAQACASACPLADPAPTSEQPPSMPGHTLLLLRLAPSGPFLGSCHKH